MSDAATTGSDLLVHSTLPLNAEPPLARLRRSRITACRDFYIRSHGAIPTLDAATHRLRVDGQVRTPLELSVRELRDRFALRTVTAVLQCAGNRRHDMQAVKPTAGDPWAPGAIGNAAWTGVALADVLRAAGAAATTGLHVAFEACDEIEMPAEGRFRYGASIPIGKALSPEVLLAFEMNGEALAPEHGHPLRLVVPGYAGVRSPKWLGAITVQDRPSDNPMQARDYKLLPADITADTVDWDRGLTINEMPLNSAICEPASGAVLPAGPVAVRGYAMASARAIARVDVSTDGGASWCQAELEHDDGVQAGALQAPASGSNASWSWIFWSASVTLAGGAYELVVRAWDEAGQTQPSQTSDVWNFKGYLSAAWHRVRVSVG